MAHTSWKGYIKLSLVSIPVRAYSVCEPAGERITLHQLHGACHSRIRYQKTCPVHGEVPNDEIVKGYEYAKDQYVVFEPEEVEQLQGPRERSLNIRAFVRPEELDPIYFSGKSYYLTPDGAAGQKPYALLHEALVKEGLYAVAQAVLSGKEELMALRPVGRLLGVSGVDYESEIRDPTEFLHELADPDFSPRELQLTKALIETTAEEHFDLSQYQDVRANRLRELVESKVQGKEIVEAPAEEPRQVINLMDALRESIARAKGGATSSRKKRTPSTPQRKSPRKKKTG